MATKIICRAINCLFNEAHRCVSAEIIYDPVEGCLTHEIEAEWEIEELMLEAENNDQDWTEDDLWLKDILNEAPDEGLTSSS